MKLNTLLLLSLLSTNGLAFTSTKYIDRITTEETVTTISYVGEKKVTTKTTNVTDPNGNTTTSTEEVVDDIYNSHFTELKNQILNNSDRLDILEQLDADYRYVYGLLSDEVDYLSSDLDSQKLALDSIESEINNLELKRMDIEARILNIQSEMVELDSSDQLAQMLAELNQEKQELAAINSYINQAKADYNNYNAELTSKISGLKDDIMDLRRTTTTRVSALSASLDELAQGFEDVVKSYCDLELKMATLLSSSASSISGCVVESPTPVNLETYSEINLKFTQALAQLNALEALYEKHVHSHGHYVTTTAEVH